jgi:hypothetical protein
MQKRIAGVVLLLVAVIAGHAQDDASAVIQKIYNAYNNNTAIHFTGSMKMYVKNDPSKIIDRIQSSYTVKNKNFSCSIGAVAMLLNDNYYVSVDNSDRLIMIGRKKDLPSVASTPVLNLDQLKSRIAGKKIQAVTAGKGTAAILQLTDIDGSSGFSMYNIEYDTTTGYMKKVVLETINYNNQAGKTMVLEINYTQPEFMAGDKNAFSEKSFFSVVNNKIQLTANYKNYQIINQL